MSKLGQYGKRERRLRVARGWEMGRNCGVNGYGFSLGSDENILEKEVVTMQRLNILNCTVHCKIILRSVNFASIFLKGRGSEGGQ